MSTFSRAAAIGLAALFAQSAMASCYIVYGPKQDVVYRSPLPPVDMSRQIHETLPQLAPGLTLVFSPSDTGCEVTVNKLPVAGASSRASVRPARADRG